jgi:hypothetical protein
LATQTLFYIPSRFRGRRFPYYYTLTSMGSDGVSDEENSPVEQFTTPGPGGRM